MTQTDRIERHMRDYGSITTRDAFIEYGCTRLPARIWDLEHKKNIRIARKTEVSLNRYGEKINYTRYSLRDNGDEKNDTI